MLLEAGKDGALKMTRLILQGPSRGCLSSFKGL